MKKLQNLSWEKWLQNTLLFLAPVILMYLVYVQTEIQIDGITANDFVPNEMLIGAMTLYIINTFIDLVKKYLKA